jgi:hypothetical protein
VLKIEKISHNSGNGLARITRSVKKNKNHPKIENQNTKRVESPKTVVEKSPLWTGGTPLNRVS